MESKRLIICSKADLPEAEMIEKSFCGKCFITARDKLTAEERERICKDGRRRSAAGAHVDESPLTLQEKKKLFNHYKDVVFLAMHGWGDYEQEYAEYFAIGATLRSTARQQLFLASSVQFSDFADFVTSEKICSLLPLLKRSKKPLFDDADGEYARFNMYSYADMLWNAVAHPKLAEEEHESGKEAEQEENPLNAGEAGKRVREPIIRSRRRFGVSSEDNKEPEEDVNTLLERLKNQLDELLAEDKDKSADDEDLEGEDEPAEGDDVEDADSLAEEEPAEDEEPIGEDDFAEWEEYIDDQGFEDEDDLDEEDDLDDEDDFDDEEDLADEDDFDEEDDFDDEDESADDDDLAEEGDLDDLFDQKEEIMAKIKRRLESRRKMLEELNEELLEAEQFRRNLFKQKFKDVFASDEEEDNGGGEDNKEDDNGKGKNSDERGRRRK